MYKIDVGEDLSLVMIIDLPKNDELLKISFQNSSTPLMIMTSCLSLTSKLLVSSLKHALVDGHQNNQHHLDTSTMIIFVHPPLTNRTNSNQSQKE
jgi:hypothetical protein